MKRIHLLLLPAVILLVYVGTALLSDGTRAHEREVLSQAIERTTSACYACEGHYPESLDYLKNHYGLTYNESRFLVDYTVTAANLRPTVLILERGDRDAAKS